MKYKICFIFSFFSLFNIQAQKLEYDIIWLGKIGTLSIDKKADKNALVIEINSEVKIPFYTLNWLTKTKTIDGQLSSSEFRHLRNQKTQEGSDIILIDKNSYTYTDNNGKQQTIEIVHPFYVSKLYYDEPLGEKYIFSERFGKPLEIIDHGDGHYRLLLPEDNYCDYFYEDGICKIVKAKNGSRTIKMILSQGT